MKVVAVLFAALLASVAAGQVKKQERFVDSIIELIISNLTEQLQELGLDPFEFTDDIDFKLAVTDIFLLHAHVEEFVMKGISNIVLDEISYDLANSVLTFDVIMPSIYFSVDSSSSDVTLFGHRLHSSLSGSVDIVNSRLRGEAIIKVGVITGSSIEYLNIDYSLENIVSNLQVSILDHDHSEKVNEILGETIPNTLHEYRNDINEVLEHYIVEFFNNRY